MTFGDADTDAITINAQFVTGAQLKTAKTDSEQVDTKQKELKDAIADGIDCVNGR
jgi:hypothetical protein